MMPRAALVELLTAMAVVTRCVASWTPPLGEDWDAARWRPSTPVRRRRT